MDIDPDNAKTYSRYRDALRAERKLKPDVRRLAVDDLRAGITVAQLAEATGMTPEVFRRIARDNDIPVDTRYQERAEKFRARAAASEHAPPRRHTPATDNKAVKRLNAKQTAELAARAFAAADPKQFDALTEAVDKGDRAVVEAALNLGVLNQTDLLIA